MSDDTCDMENFDWKGMEAVAVEQLVAAVRDTRTQIPDHHIYGAMFVSRWTQERWEPLYLSWPDVVIGTEESLAQGLAKFKDRGTDTTASDDDLEQWMRWSAFWWPEISNDWNDRPRAQGSEIGWKWVDRYMLAWAECNQVEIDEGNFGGVQVNEMGNDCFLHAFARAAKRARAQLVREGIVGEDFIAIVDTPDQSHKFIPLSLTKKQLARHFPKYGKDTWEWERARLAALPVAQRIAELVQQLRNCSSAYTLLRPTLGDAWEDGYLEMLHELGEAAVPAVTDAFLTAPKLGNTSNRAIFFLIEVNCPVPESVVTFLEQRMMTDSKKVLEACMRTARMLAHLGRMDVVVRHFAQLPVEAVIWGLTGPYCMPARNEHRPLDYSPLKAALREHPELADDVASAITKDIEDVFSSSDADFFDWKEDVLNCCRVFDDSEIATARAALRSPWEAIRKHAKRVLEIQKSYEKWVVGEAGQT